LNFLKTFVNIANMPIPWIANDTTDAKAVTTAIGCLQASS